MIGKLPASCYLYIHTKREILRDITIVCVLWK